MAFFDCDGVRLYLSAPERRPDFAGRSTIYCRVPAHVVRRDEASELWMADLRDPDGNSGILMSEVRVACEVA
jgi:hypothetical protein